MTTTEDYISPATAIITRRARTIQAYGHLVPMPLVLHESACQQSVDCEQSDVAMPIGTAVRLHATKTNNTDHSMSRSARKAIQSKTLKVSSGWSEQVRADRRRVGIARLVWLQNLVGHT